MRDGCKAFVNRFMCLWSKRSFKFTILSIDMHLYLQITQIYLTWNISYQVQLFTFHIMSNSNIKSHIKYNYYPHFYLVIAFTFPQNTAEVSVFSYIISPEAVIPDTNFCIWRNYSLSRIWFYVKTKVKMELRSSTESDFNIQVHPLASGQRPYVL